MNKYSEKLIFESVDVITSRSSYKRGVSFLFTQTNIYLITKDTQGKRLRLGINENYSFLDKSQIVLSYVQVLGKRCPLRLDAIFENKTYSLKDWGTYLPLRNDIESFLSGVYFGAFKSQKLI